MAVTERMQLAIRRLQSLPDERQNDMAKRILDEIDEMEWDAIVSKPQVQQSLRRLAAEARQQDAAGETEEGGFGRYEKTLTLRGFLRYTY